MKKILSLLMLLVAIVSGAWADSYTFKSDASTTDANFPVGAALTNYEYSGKSDLKLISLAKDATFTFTNTNGYTITGVTAQGFAQNNSDKEASVTLSDGTNEATTGTQTWANRQSDISAISSYALKISNNEDLSNLKSDAGTTYTVTVKGYALGMHLIVTYTTDGGLPAIGPTITTQPQDAEYEIGTTTYPSMSVEATTSAGSLTYEWRWGPDGENYAPFPSGKVPSSRTATLSIEEVIGMLQPTGNRTLYIECTVTDDDASVNSDAAILTIKAPAAGPTITTQPQDATYVIGTEDYPSMSIEATASAGDLKYQWHIIVSETDVTIPGATTSTLSLATYASSPAFAPYLSQEGAYSIYCNVADDNDNVDSDMATLTVTATAPATTVSAPTFDKTEGAEIKAGDPIIVTSDDGSQIYYNWSGKATGGYTAEQLLTRTPKDSPASVTTSTTGNRYLYALAKKGDLVSEISILGVKVDPNPVKGLLDKTEDNVEAGTEVEAPVFSVVDAENNPSPASIAYGTATNKDVTVNFAIDPASTNSGIITLKADGSGIESINTTSGGTAIVNITLTSNKDGYPIIDGESGIYTYTITVTGGEPITVNYTKSVNIEQLVLDNGVNYDITKDFAENYVEYASINALDSLNDADGKVMRNEPFLGLKLKTLGAYIKVTLKQGSSLKVKLGNIGDNVKVNINGTEQEDIVKMTTKDASYMTTVYEYTADDADAVVTFTTSSASTVVFKQIMIDEEIAQVILPYAVDMPEAAANGTVEMPASANPGDVVTIVATPAEGYELDAITVTGKSSNTAYEVSADNTFTMPDENVNVTVTFKQITGINGIAEDAAVAENANVKVIKNGNLYIGKFNIAGQQVK